MVMSYYRTRRAKNSRVLDILKDHSNAVSIFDAAAKGDLSDLAKVLKENDINAVNASNETLLHIAAANGHLAIIEYLINKGAKLNVKDKKGRTPLHRAAEKGQDDAVKVLLQAGAYIYSLDKEAKTPLHLASNLAQMLLKNGAPVDAKEEKGQTALGYAISQGFEKTHKTS
uniref:Ankyrin repeat domain-containing protein n=1 Tax=Chrysemys picta bellii TaxID=8478 RepID=A0A8C3HKV3_CHRPI